MLAMRGIRVWVLFAVVWMGISAMHGLHHGRHGWWVWLIPIWFLTCSGRVRSRHAQRHHHSQRSPRQIHATSQPLPAAPPRGDMRISDGDRDRVVDFLRQQLVDGRLRSDEFGDRVQAALDARTWDEVRDLTRDLPSRF